ncbi:hypothetical protein FH609_025820 [Streptomyces sp. 3MP-14]|uniref:Uncharacterized protein n=1 Tax=Streptomyces mimosae TaxID=2586635 RepID=A0A5N6A298_9ACTN|nr:MULTISPECIES: hypothetical protein [Streptomyces]KAB8162026.1 hypothetical protein FH607_023470 [Streptomyces mimosae]KAB8173724.1 hypothetical protein FH609_025820 [Streptomyces sp. 3MP-14]
MSSPVEDASRQAAQQMAAMLRTLVELTRALDGARRPSLADAGPAVGGPRPAVRYAAVIEQHFGPQVRQALTDSPGWQRMVEQLGELEGAGIPPERLLPALEQITRQAQPAPPTPEQEMARVVERATSPEVAQALTRSEQWPQLAAGLQDLRAGGWDVEQLVAAAVPTLNRLVEGAQAEVGREAADAGRQQSRQVLPARPVDRETALRKAGIDRHENERLSRMVREKLPERPAELLLASDTQWPIVAAEIHRADQSGVDVAARLAGVENMLRHQAAAGARQLDIPVATLAALSMPAPPPAVKQLDQERTGARTLSREELTRASDLAVANHGVSATMLLASGYNAAQAGEALTALEQYGIVGARGESGMHPIQVGSVEQAGQRIAAGVEREIQTQAATAWSTTVSGPPAARRVQRAVTGTAPQAPIRTTGRRR